MGQSRAGAEVESGTAADCSALDTARASTVAVDALEDWDPDLSGQERLIFQNIPIAGDRTAQIDPGQPQSATLELVNHDTASSTANVSRAIELKDGSIAYLTCNVGPGAVHGLTPAAAGDLLAIVLKPCRRLSKYTTVNNASGLKVVTHMARYVFERVNSTNFGLTVDVGANTVELGGTSNSSLAGLDSLDATRVAAQIQAVIDNTALPDGGARQAPAECSLTEAAAFLAGGAGDTIVVRAPSRDQLGTGTGLGAIAGADVWALEEPTPGTGNSGSASNKQAIAEIDIKVDSVAVTAQTKKLKAKWSPELGQDLNAYHNLDAEVELTGILSEQIALEIDRELLGELVRGATAGTRYWSRAPGLFVNSEGVEQGASSAAPDFTGTVSEWYETLIETINDVSAQIHRKTLRGGANFVVCSPEVANILEFTSGFRASVTADQDRGTIGAVKAGSLSKKFDVYVDPYFIRNVVLVGRKGSSFLESGYVYAPYVPLQVTPTIFGTEDFVPRKGVMTRYAKKMVRPDMYGLVIVRGLLGESGATA
jgi:hypothetical protein